MKPFGDRRARVRYEVVGALFGLLEVAEPAHVINISTTGALITSPQPVPVGSSQPVLFTVNGKQVPMSVTVRRVQLIEGGETPQFHVGVEFVSSPEPLIRSIGLDTELFGE